jgi:DNA repair protein RadA
VKIWKIAQQYHNLNARTAKTIISQQGSILKCSTGSSALDQLLGGGITTRAMTEFFGEAGMGKTQICYTAAVFALLPKQAGGFIDFDPASVDRPRVVWLDTEQTFNPNRIIEIVQNRFPKIQPDDILTNIIVYQVMSTDQLLLAVQEVFQNPDNVVLIILDSIMALYRFEYSHGVSELARRQQKLQEMIGIIKRNLVIRNTALLVTNQATTKMAMIGPMNLTTVEAAGGFAVAHAVTHRIKLTKKSAGKNKGLTIRKATIVDSPYLGSGEAEFILSPQGVLDFERTTTKVSKSKGSLAKEEFETEAEIEVEAEAEAEAETDEDISFE